MDNCCIFQCIFIVEAKKIWYDNTNGRMIFMHCLHIEDLHVKVEDKMILKGVNLTIRNGETHALMGPNGNGKSTLLAAIMGNPKYQVSQGKVTLDDHDVLKMEVDERSKAGLFLGMQYPSEISGVSNADFLRAALNARLAKPIPLFEFIKEMENSIDSLQMKSDLAHRFLNEGFSGGEKKRNEIVQMKMLKPTIAMLDEIDSGLDVDALRIVAAAIKDMQANQSLGCLVISHYARFFELLKPTHVHILMDGVIVESGNEELIALVDQGGYEYFEAKHHVKAQQISQKPVNLLGTCAIKKEVE